MPVVVTPESRSPALDALDVVSVVADAAASVAAVEDADADALVVDSPDPAVLTAIRNADGGSAVPVVLITTEEYPIGPADAVVAPDADTEVAQDAIDRAQAAAEYRTAVGDLYEACRNRSAGQPDESIRDLREAADHAYEDLDELPPSAFHPSADDEQ